MYRLPPTRLDIKYDEARAELAESRARRAAAAAASPPAPAAAPPAQPTVRERIGLPAQGPR
jgi:hypothetical protein